MNESMRGSRGRMHYRLLGIAEGYANVLFDTPCVANRYLRTVNKVQAVAERLSKTLEMR